MQENNNPNLLQFFESKDCAVRSVLDKSNKEG